MVYTTIIYSIFLVRCLRCNFDCAYMELIAFLHGENKEDTTSGLILRPPFQFHYNPTILYTEAFSRFHKGFQTFERFLSIRHIAGRHSVVITQC